MPESESTEGVEVLHTRQQHGAGPSRTVKSTATTRQQQPARRRGLRQPPEEPQQNVPSVIDLTADRPDDDDDVEITQIKNVKRPRRQDLGGTSGAGVQAALPAAQPQPPAPPSPKGYKCIICYDIMEKDLATTTCGHMFCFKCISEWVQKSGNCPQCRGKLTKSKIIRIYPPS
ncbi:hypothetical protein Agub_g13122 [Astrephomene gubernaculifera]|uniref:RING-type domain-containing protein n=1 Tax=Astrephomene gubernaculifera TaxID=47775 RepID=A0AAD3DZS9_9CHLO|nr:hypothetical protein Agub_g13122 [Astrephomene gubernaculifera]